MYKTELEFGLEHERLTYRINCVQESINRLNEDIILLNTKRNMQFKRKAELLQQLEKLININQLKNG